MVELITITKGALVPTKQNKILEDFRNAEEAEALDATRLRAFLGKQKKQLSIGDVADHFDTSPKRVRVVAAELQTSHTNLHITNDVIYLTSDIPKAQPTVVDRVKAPESEIVFGVTGDNHICSLYSRNDVLSSLFDRWEEAGVKTVYQLGNIIDGEARFNIHDIKARGIKGQTDMLIEEWPQRKGVTTQFITGDDHEGWYVQREGIDIGRHIQSEAEAAGRTDLKYLGHMEHDIILKAKSGAAVMLLMHPGGGSAYATSYTAQKICESLTGGEKPNVLIMGHYHKAEYGYPREIHALQSATTMDQSPFMRKKRLAAHVGGWTVRLRQNDAGIITTFAVEWHPYFDRSFYSKTKWSYKWDAKRT